MPRKHRISSVVGFMIVASLSLAAAWKPAHSMPRETAEEEQGMDILEAILGEWEGTCRTWFRPGELADESSVRGKFVSLLDGKIVRHTYEGSMQGKPRHGEETIAFNALEEIFQVSWFDDFHMNYALLFSEGKKTEQGFSVSGRYRMGADQEYWGWRTEFAMTDLDQLTITAYNITPDGQEAKAVLTEYVRTRPTSE